MGLRDYGRITSKSYRLKPFSERSTTQVGVQVINANFGTCYRRTLCSSSFLKSTTLDCSRQLPFVILQRNESLR